jgi:glutaredoxin
MRTRFLAVLLLLPALAQAQMYRWLDDKGKVHFSDRPPASGARNLQKQSLPAAQGAAPPLPYALQQPVRNFPVTLYTSQACGDACAKARELLNQRGVPYSEASVADEEDLANLQQLSGGNSVPVMTVGREVLKGFEAGAYASALDNAGYPASSLLPPGVQARKPVDKPPPKAAPAAAPPAAPAAAPPATETEGAPLTAPQETANPSDTSDSAAPK